MIGSFLIRGLMMVFGYAYPAYECYKTVEKSKPEIEQLRFWCRYWILVAFLTVCERVGDTFISWVPMYSEAKLAFLIYLWYPKTKGTTYVYDSFFRPYVAKHENEIDRNLLELRTRAGDLATLYWSYVQTRVFEILQYVAAQSTSVPHPSQQQRQGARTRPPPNGLNRQPSSSTPGRQPAMTLPKTEEPPSPTSCTSSNQCQMEVAGNVGPSQVPEAGLPAPTASLNAIKVNVRSETSIQTAPTKAEATQIEAMPSSSANEDTSTPTKETIMEETIRSRD